VLYTVKSTLFHQTRFVLARFGGVASRTVHRSVPKLKDTCRWNKTMQLAELSKTVDWLLVRHFHFRYRDFQLALDFHKCGACVAVSWRLPVGICRKNSCGRRQQKHRRWSALLPAPHVSACERVTLA